MVALSHGVPMVTTSGWLTEALWEESGAAWCSCRPTIGAALAGGGGAAAGVAFGSRAARMRGRSLYEARFDMAHTIRTLRAADAIPHDLAAVTA